VGSLDGRELPPLCPECNGILRPKVVLFDEALPAGAIDRLYDEMDIGFDAVFTIGTSSTFPYIVQPVVWAIRNRIPTVEINPTKTNISEHVDYHLMLGAAEAMNQILSLLHKDESSSA
jgi:NAD-dependent deacetylase